MLSNWDTSLFRSSTNKRMWQKEFASRSQEVLKATRRTLSWAHREAMDGSWIWGTWPHQSQHRHEDPPRTEGAGAAGRAEGGRCFIALCRRDSENWRGSFSVVIKAERTGSGRRQRTECQIWIWNLRLGGLEKLILPLIGWLIQNAFDEHLLLLPDTVP